MLSLERCAAVLNKREKIYSPIEIKKIRDLLYQIGYMDYELYSKSMIMNGESGQTNTIIKGRGLVLET